MDNAKTCALIKTSVKRPVNHFSHVGKPELTSIILSQAVCLRNLLHASKLDLSHTLHQGFYPPSNALPMTPPRHE